MSKDTKELLEDVGKAFLVIALICLLSLCISALIIEYSG